MAHDLTRRTFLAAATSAAALPALPGTPRRSRKKAVKLYMVAGKATLLEKFQLLARLGFDGVELDSPSALARDEVLAAKEATGLSIPGVVDSVHWQQTLSHPDAAVRDKGRAALVTALEDCKAYGGTTVLLVPAVVSKQVSYADAWKRSQEEITKVLPRCQELGVRIALENVWNHFLLSPLEFARYLDDFRSEWIGAHFDPGNVVTYGWPEHWIATLGKRILKIDVKEFSRKKRDDLGLWKGFDCPLGEGDTDWPAVVKALDAIGYQGWFTAEMSAGDEKHLSDLAARMDGFLK
jgi:hexulose-6-phosphate isomerase